MNFEICPLCNVKVKINEKGRFVQHEKFQVKTETWRKNTVCKKSGKKC